MVIGVFGFGYVMWLFAEKKYRKLNSQENT